MPRYIDADWITQKLDGWQDQLAETYGQNDEYVLCLGEVLMKIDDAPTADVVERKVGKWIPSFDRWGDIVTTVDGYRCSECGSFNADKDNYCPSCGAEMVDKDTDVPNKV